ncbi:MAG: PAS domain-containing protein [Verrucomicrobia bacterium]|nr:PAS domain-containing protein [Verrucomicrobiota bacterium]
MNLQISKKISLLLAIVALCISSVSLIGWFFHIPILTSWGPGFATMKVNTGVAFVIAAISLALLQREELGTRYTLGKFCAAVVTLIGLLTFGEHLFGVNLGIDELLLAVPPEAASRMSPLTSIVLVLIGFALLLIDTCKHFRANPTEILSAVSLTVSLVGVLGYLYGTQAFYRIGIYGSMALHTAASGALMGFAILLARPSRGLPSLLARKTAGAKLARRLLPAAILVPVLAGWLRILGERMGLYESPFGTGLFATTLVGIFVALIWATAVSLDTGDLKREQADAALRASQEALREGQERYRTLFNSMDEGFCIIEMIFDENQRAVDYRFIEINPAFEKQTGLHGAAGKRILEFVSNIEPHWLENYGRVALTGVPIRFADEYKSLGRWFDVFAFRMGDVASHRVAVLFNNITQRKQVEQSLRDSEERMRLATDATEVGVWEWNIHTDQIRWDAQMFRIYGIAPTPDGLVHYRDWTGAVLPEDLPGQEEALKETVRRRGTSTREFRILRRDDRQCRALQAVETIRWNVQGQAEWVVGTNLDITERKRAEEALHESQERLQAALDGSGAGTFRWNIQTNALQWDKNLDHLFGLPPGQTIQSLENFIATIHPDDRAEVIKSCQRCASDGADFDREFRVIWPDGSVHWLDDKGTTFRDAQGRPLHMTGMCLNITERKRAEEALRESEAQFRALADNMGPMAWMANPDGYLFFYNKRWYEYTGTTFEEMQGWGWQKVQHPGQLDRMLPNWKHALATGEPWEDIFPLRRHDGVYRWFLSRAFPIRDQQGNITRWFGTNTDITELRETQAKLQQAQTELQQYATSLEHKVAERTADLKATNNQLEAFVYSIAHDLRAPLRAMQGFSQALLDEYSSNLDDTGKHFLQRINASSEFMDKMIMDLLAFGRAGRLEIELEPVKVQSAWDDAVFQCAREIEQTNTQIEVVTPLPTVLAHQAALTQILANLLSNAIKFVSPGVQPKIRFWSEDSGPAVRLWVEDNGVGIPREYHERIFRVFERLQGARFSGTGIGLSIVRKGVERMDGKVGLESEPSQGTRFWIELQKG